MEWVYYTRTVSVRTDIRRWKVKNEPLRVLERWKSTQVRKYERQAVGFGFKSFQSQIIFL